MSRRCWPGSAVALTGLTAPEQAHSAQQTGRFGLITREGRTRKLMVASRRYLDAFVKVGGGWLFAERKLYVDWTETRPSAP